VPQTYELICIIDLALIPLRKVYLGESSSTEVAKIMFSALLEAHFQKKAFRLTFLWDQISFCSGISLGFEFDWRMNP
jgi:hypothetical protein